MYNILPRSFGNFSPVSHNLSCHSYLNSIGFDERWKDKKPTSKSRCTIWMIAFWFSQYRGSEGRDQIWSVPWEINSIRLLLRTAVSPKPFRSVLDSFLLLWTCRENMHQLDSTRSLAKNLLSTSSAKHVLVAVGNVGLFLRTSTIQCSRIRTR